MSGGRQDQGPGVPEALPRTIQGLGRRLLPETLDRIWIFPPLIRGRKEWGLVAVSRFSGAEREDRRGLFTAPYVAERTGKGLEIEWQLEEQGAAPDDRFPRMMDGVVRRAGSELGDPREVEIAGESDRFDALLDELGRELLEPEPPARPVQPTAPESATPTAGVPPAPAPEPQPVTDP
jgi:hypothetical protein